MDTTELKKIVARHYDFAPHGTGQLLHGDWFTPKHKESLEYLLDEVQAANSERFVVWRDKLKDVKEAVENMEEELEEAA